MSRRTGLIVASVVGALVVVGLVVALLRPVPTDDGEGAFCELYPRIANMAAMLARGLDHEARPDDLPPDNYRALANIVWADDVAAGGPDHLDADAVAIARSVRRAAREQDSAPLHTEAFRASVERVQAGAREACPADP